MSTEIATTRGTYVSVGDGDWDERSERFYAGEQLEEPPATAPALTAEERRYAEYGGVSVGAAFFGWLSALGVTMLLAVVVATAGLLLGAAPDLARTGGLVVRPVDAVLAAVAAGVLLVLGCYAGSYAAGRFVRFDGGRQGVAVWVLTVVTGLVAAGVGVVVDAQYGVIASPSFPDVTVARDDLVLGSAVAAGVTVVLMLLVAVGGGKLGVRYHAKVDRVGLEPQEEPLPSGTDDVWTPGSPEHTA